MEFSANPFLSVGKPVRDEYGRQIGRVASFMVSLSGRVNGVLVARGDGEFFRYPSDQFIADDEGVRLLSLTKQRANEYSAEDTLLELEALTACMHNWIERIKKSHSAEECP